MTEYPSWVMTGGERAGLAVQDERGLWTRTSELLIERRAA